MRLAASLGRPWAIPAVIVVLYLAFVVLACVRQRSMLYFPHIGPRSQIAEFGRRVGLVLWPAGGEDYFGLISEQEPAAPKGTVMAFHGNAGTAVDRAYYMPALERLGYRVILYEYPGYGARKGKLAEKTFVEDARRAARRALEEFGEPLYVWGESLGCGVASALAGDRETSVAGAVLLTPWDSLPDLAQSLYWYMPAKWLVRDKYDNIWNLRDFEGPVAVVVAGRDEIIPAKRTERLYRSLSGTKKRWDFPDAGHNSWPTSPQGEWWKEVMDFVAARGEGS